MRYKHAHTAKMFESEQFVKAKVVKCVQGASGDIQVIVKISTTPTNRLHKIHHFDIYNLFQ